MYGRVLPLYTHTAEGDEDERNETSGEQTYIGRGCEDMWMDEENDMKKNTRK